MIWPTSLSYLRQDINQVQDAQILLMCIITFFLPHVSPGILVGVFLSWVVTRLCSCYSLRYTGATRARDHLGRMARAQIFKWLAVIAAIFVGIKLQFNALSLIFGYALGQICYFSAAFTIGKGRLRYERRAN